MADFTIRPASRTNIRILVCLYAESGCGKTYSSLLLARGYAGPTGKIGMIDTENRRGEFYADVIPGGYSVLPLDEPFSPDRYIAAMETMEAAGICIGVLDSGSHEWEGPGGVLEQAAENEAKSGKPGLHNWRLPKMAHGLWVRRLLRAPIPWIICLRAKYKNRQTKDERGKTQIVKDDYASPLQAEDFIFESSLHGQIMPDHSLVITKSSHPGLRGCFPDHKPITQEHGATLAAWCASGGAPAPAAAPAAPARGATPSDQKGLIAELWKMCEPFRGTENSWKAAWAQLAAWKIIDPAKHPKPSTLTVEELIEVLDKTSLAIGQSSDITP